MYSISGAAGTIAATTALFLNVTFGFSFTFLTGMAAYIIAAFLLLTILRK
jgi:phage shock protein PspC (stress-responsive transcriptional regulator)